MRVSRLYLPQPLTLGQPVPLDQEQQHYLSHVLRLKSGAALVVFNGDGGEYQGQVQFSGRRHASVMLTEHRPGQAESPLTVKLGLVISRGERMDYALQKSVELGVTSVTPLTSERCVVKLDEDRAQNRLAHWDKIVQHAAQQSGRTLKPVLHPIMALPDWLDRQSGTRVFLDPEASASLPELGQAVRELTLLSGPEGGFNGDERHLAIAHAFMPVRLGSRILRTETACVAALAAAQTLWGDFR
ncbi:MAG: 16S rRNA (uracil(1498)-N(3))-methyltransferase [Methylococcales bacterium]|nr:16S rRNA (uracil(1498)-N(3))-methyltransferase [Methylococcales bacterium]